MQSHARDALQEMYMIDHYNDYMVWMGSVNPAWLFLMALVSLVFSFIPAFIAYSRHHPNRTVILVLDFLLGWTGIGWIILLVWALERPHADLDWQQRHGANDH
jgi:hypothetical protein